jgi:hypothetical protein
MESNRKTDNGITSSTIQRKVKNFFGEGLFDKNTPDCLVQSNAFGELPYHDSLSCYELGRILYAGINPQIKIMESDKELFALLTIAKNTGMRSDKLGVYIMRAVSLILQNSDRKRGYDFHGYRGRIAENLRDDGLRAAIDAIKYWNPERKGKGEKPAYSFLTYCIIRRMKGTLTRHKKKIINQIKRAEKNGNLANPELYVCLGAFTKETYFDGRKISNEGDNGVFEDSHAYFNRLKQQAQQRIKEKYGNNKPADSEPVKAG